MHKKWLNTLLATTIFAGGILTQRVFDTVQADGWNGLVYSVNGTSGDATGNVTVSN